MQTVALCCNFLRVVGLTKGFPNVGYGSTSKGLPDSTGVLWAYILDSVGVLWIYRGFRTTKHGSELRYSQYRP